MCDRFVAQVRVFTVTRKPSKKCPEEVAAPPPAISSDELSKLLKNTFHGWSSEFSSAINFSCS